MKVVLDLSQLLEDGEITQAEADKLKRLSVKSTGSLAFNILIGFGVIAVALGAIMIVPDAITGIVLGAIILAFGLVLLHYSPVEWGVLGNICIILGALGLGGGVVYMTQGSIWAFLGCAVGFAVAAIVARSGLLMALSILALSSVLGARTGYFHASYFLGIKEPTLTIIVFSLIALVAYQVSLFVGAAYERLALMAARVSILLVNFGFWIASLWGDRLEQVSSLLGRTKENIIFIPRVYFVIGWALALIAFAVWAMRNDRRWVVNVCAVFGAIHFYTQFFERLGPNPLAILLGGDVGAAGHAPQHAFDFVRLFDQHVEIVAEQLNAQIGAHPGHDFVHPQLDRLRIRQPLARHVAQQEIELVGELGLRAGLRPLRARFERDENVGQFHAHRIGGDLGRADAAPDVRHFVGEGAKDRLLDAGVVANRFR